MKKYLMLVFILFISLIFYGCFGGGGGEKTSTTTTTSTVPGASLTVLVDPTTTTTTRATDTSISQGKATLIVDINNDGIFNEQAGDKKYEGIISADGKVQFKDIEVPSTGIVKAKIRIEKNGRAPYEKIIKLSKDASLTLKVTTTPVQKVTEEIGNNVTLTKRGYPIYLIFSLKNDNGKKRIEVRTSTRRDAGVDPNTELQAIIPGGIIPSNVTAVSASMKRFSGVSDRNYFPGEFRGVGAPSQYVRRDGDNEFQLKSVAFSLIRLEDQNGKPLKFETRRDDELIDVTIAIPDDAVGQICEDADNSTANVQVPIYKYDYYTGNWEYIRTGTLYYSNGTPVASISGCLTGTGYYVKFQVTPEEWVDYWNIDYPVWFGGEPKEYTMCVKLVDVNGTPLSNGYVWAEGEGTSFYGWTDDNGIAQFKIPVNPTTSNPLDWIKNNYHFYYSYYPFGVSMGIISNDTITQSSITGCDFIAQISLKNYFDSKIIVKVHDENGNPVSNVDVSIWSNDYTYWNYGYTDKNGEVSFNVKSNTLYGLWVMGQEKDANVDGIINNSEDQDNGQTVIIDVTKENQPPEVYVWVYPDPVKESATTMAYISAYDPNGDKVSLVSVTWNGTNVSCSGSDGYWTCPLNTKGMSGSIEFKVTVTDGEKTNTLSYMVTVLSSDQNHPPEIYGITLYDNSTGYPVWDWNTLQVNKAYIVEAYGWDPDANDTISKYTYSIKENGGSCSDNVCVFTSEGEYTLVVNATDTNGATTTETYKLKVLSEESAIEIEQVWVDKNIVNPGDQIEVHAYLYNLQEATTCMYDMYNEYNEEKTIKTTRSIEATDVTVQINGENATVDNSQIIDYGCGFYEYMGNVTIPDTSEDSVKITVKIGDNEASITVWTQVPNMPPVFNKALPASLTLNKGTTYTFEVSAYDPEGSSISYEWYVKYGYTGSYEKQATTSSSFTYTFNDAGTYWIRCVAKDENGTTSSTESVVIVTSGETTGKIILHLGIGGIYVAIHNSTLAPISVKQTDENGDVEFDNINGPTWVSISFTPDMYISGILLDKAKDELFNNLVEAICLNSNDTNCTNQTCLPIDNVTTLITGLAVDAGYSNLTSINISQYDVDSNGCLDKDELWSIVSSIIDSDGNGELSIAELNQFDEENFIKISSILVKLPQGEYDLTGIIRNMEEFKEDWISKEVTVTVENMPLTYINVYGPDNSYTSISTWYTSTNQGVIEIKDLQNDGAYSLIFIDTNNKLCSYVLDQTGNNVVTDYNSFKPVTQITFYNYNDTYWADIEGIYKGVTYNLGFYENGANYICYVPGMKYAINYEGELWDNNTWRWQTAHVVYDDLPLSVDLSEPEYAFLDIAINQTENGTYQLSGADLDKINEWGYYLSKFGDLNGNNVYFEFVLVNWGVPPSTISLYNATQILPSEVVDKYLTNGTWFESYGGFNFISWTTDEDILSIHLSNRDEEVNYKLIEFDLGDVKRSTTKKKLSSFFNKITLPSINKLIKDLFKK